MLGKFVSTLISVFIFSLLLCSVLFSHLAFSFEVLTSLNFQNKNYLSSSGTDNDYIVKVDYNDYLDNFSWSGVITASSLSDANYDVYDDRLFIEQLSLKYAFEWLDVEVGRLDLRYGRATFVNPTDYFDPKDYRDVILSTDRRLATDALNVVSYLPWGELIVVIAPGMNKSLMPHTNKRWFFDLPSTLTPPVGDVINLDYAWQEYNQYQTSFSSPQTMIRFDQNIKQSSYSISYYKGEDNVPTFGFGSPLTQANGLLIPLEQNYPDKEAIGFDLEVSFDAFIFRLEAANTILTAVDGAKDKYQNIVFGFDTTFSKGIFSKETFLAIEYSKQFSNQINDYQREDIRHLFKNTLFIKLDVELNNYHNLGLEVIYDDQNYQSAALLAWQYQFNDQLLTEFYGDFMAGDKDTFFGQYSNNRLGIKMEYIF